jgi:hypothetical protein
MNINEIQQLVKECDYKYCALFDDINGQIEPYNKSGRASDDFDRILKRLKSQPAGKYEIWCRNTLTKTAKIDRFEFEKTDGTPAPPVLSETINPRYLENKAYLDLAIANAELKKDTEIQSLKNEIASLKAHIKDLEEQLSEIDIEAESFTLGEEQKTPSLMENAKEFLSSLMEYGAPLLDKHFQLKEQALQLEALKIANRPQPANQDPNAKAKKIVSWINSKANDGETFALLQECYQGSKTIAEFVEKVNNIDQNLANELREQI